MLRVLGALQVHCDSASGRERLAHGFLHDRGEAGSGTCPESGKPVVYRPIGYATAMATAITPGSLRQGDELTFPERGVTAHVM